MQKKYEMNDGQKDDQTQNEKQYWCARQATEMQFAALANMAMLCSLNCTSGYEKENRRQT